MKKNGPINTGKKWLKMSILNLITLDHFGPKYSAVVVYLFDKEIFKKLVSVQKMDQKTVQKTDRWLFCIQLILNCLQVLFLIKRTDVVQCYRVYLFDFQHFNTIRYRSVFF